MTTVQKNENSDPVALSELTHGGNKRAPGYEVHARPLPTKAKQYRLTTQVYAYGRIWEAGSIIPYDGDQPGSNMILVEDEPGHPAEMQAPKQITKIKGRVSDQDPI